MIRVKENFFFIVLAVFFSFSVVAIYNLSLRPALPFPVKFSDKGVVIAPGKTSQLTNMNPKTSIIALNDKFVQSIHEVDEIVDRSNIGNIILVRFSTGQSFSVALIAR
ncbi:MAG: hypothetical protein JSW33_08975, partial [bacterium]